MAPLRHLVGMIARADERAAGDFEESQRARHPPQFVEFVGRKIADDRKVPGRGLKILPQGHEVAADRAEVGQGFDDLLGCLAEAEHEPALGQDARARGLHVAQDLEAEVVLALAADMLLEPGNRLEVVVEDLGAGGEDDVDGNRRGRRSRA